MRAQTGARARRACRRATRLGVHVPSRSSAATRSASSPAARARARAGRRRRARPRCVEQRAVQRPEAAPGRPPASAASRGAAARAGAAAARGSGASRGAGASPCALEQPLRRASSRRGSLRALVVAEDHDLDASPSGVLPVRHAGVPTGVRLSRSSSRSRSRSTSRITAIGTRALVEEVEQRLALGVQQPPPQLDPGGRVEVVAAVSAATRHSPVSWRARSWYISRAAVDERLRRCRPARTRDRRRWRAPPRRSGSGSAPSCARRAASSVPKPEPAHEQRQRQPLHSQRDAR